MTQPDLTKMQLYDGGRAPNPRRVRVFWAEKGLPFPQIVPIDLTKRDQETTDFLKINPAGQIPVLVLDDGTAISETMAICRYLEALHPEPALLGRGALGQAKVEMWNRRIEFGLYAAVQAVFRHSHPAMAGLESPQLPEWAEVNRKRVAHNLAILEEQLAGRSFICGEEFTVADITAGITIDFMKPAKLALDEQHGNIRRWYAAVSARPSWSA